MKIRKGFVSNSSSSSFIIFDYNENYELSSYEITIGDNQPSEEECEIFKAIAEEFEDRPSHDEMELHNTDIPKTWEKYEFKMQKYLQMKIPLDLSFAYIFEIIKKFNEAKKNED